EDYHDTAPVHAILSPQTGMADPGAIHQLQGVGMSFMGAKVVHSAVEIGLFAELARRPLEAEGLRLRLGLPQRGARGLFDALVALGLLDRRDGVYANTEVTATFLGDPTADSYAGGFLEFAGSQWYQSWGGLTDALRTGRSQAYDGDRPFETIHADPEL